MFVRVNKEGRVVEYETDKDSGCCYTNDNPIVLRSTPPLIHEFIKGHVLFEHPYVCIDGDTLAFLALPAQYHGDVYYAHLENKDTVISDKFFALASLLGEATFNKEYTQYFLNKSYLPSGETWLKEVKRFIPHSVYRLEQGCFEKKSIEFKKILSPGGNQEELYPIFAESLNLLVDFYAKGKKNAVLLSGGVDSRLLAVLLKLRGHEVETFTARQIPYTYSNLSDVENARKISDVIGVSHKIVDTDFNKLNIEVLDDVIENMPNAMHLSAFFLDLSKRLHLEGVDNMWCGQNVDNLYNLGPTGRFSLSFSGVMNLYKRFCISEQFFKTYSSVEGYNPVVCLLGSAVGMAGKTIYAKMKKLESLRMPQCPDELVYNFLTSYDDTIFSRDLSTSNCDKKTTGCKPKDIKDAIYNGKVENYLHGGASSIVSTSASMSQLRVVMPYSSEMMLPIFNEVRLNLRDLFFPKRFIYRHLSEHTNCLGSEIDSFEPIARTELGKKYENPKNVHDAAKFIVEKTEFGRSLSGFANGHHIPAGYTGIQTLQTLIAHYWMYKVRILLTAKYEVDLKVKS